METNKQFWIVASVMTALTTLTPAYLLWTGEVFGAVLIGVPTTVVLLAVLGLNHGLMKT
jgi:hypothetical protein